MSFFFALILGGACFGIASAAFLLGREAAEWRWVVSGRRLAANPGSAALAAVSSLGRTQEGIPGLKSISTRLHEKPSRWLGAYDPGSAAWLVLKETGAIVFGAAGLILLDDVALALVLAAGGFFAPDLVARDRYERRQEQVRRDLPDCLDLLALAVEAGMSLDAGLKQVSEKLRGRLLPDAFARMLGEIRFGVRRHQAWRELAAKLRNPELKETMAALVQADRMGVGLAGTLRGLSDQMRVRRRQRLEALAHKAPVKMLFPLTLCIFPAVFIVLLGPVFLQLARAVNP